MSYSEGVVGTWGFCSTLPKNNRNDKTKEMGFGFEGRQTMGR